MRVTWIGGWAVAPESLRPLAEKHFAGSQNTFIAPAADCIRKVLECGGSSPTAGADLTIAWSLGAWRVLEAASRGVEFPGMVLLLAPFVAFPAEAGLGGKCSATQVKFLRRWLQREPLAALTDFYQRAGLGAPPAELPYPAADLLEGLDRLAEDAPPALRDFAERGLRRNWQALVGDDDPLLDAEAVWRSLPGSVRVRGVGHAIADLLRASQV
jgi:hypothetical protein